MMEVQLQSKDPWTALVLLYFPAVSLQASMGALGLDEVRQVQFAPCSFVELLLDGVEEVEGSQGAEDPEGWGPVL